MMSEPMIAIGLMSGTSLDGVDALMVSFSDEGRLEILGRSHADFPEALRSELLALALGRGENEIERMGVASRDYTRVCADAVEALLDETGMDRDDVRVIGSHGQTIRHRPEKGFTLQIQQPALLAEITAIDVVADFRARDIAAQGEGAPLVPAFHAALFQQKDPCAVLNIGGIANVTLLPAKGSSSPVRGFDTGPGNMLLDTWVRRAWHEPFDRDGRHAQKGRVSETLLSKALGEPYFGRRPPKSTGRELFSPEWLSSLLGGFEALPPEDVAATLVELTARTAARAVLDEAPETRALFVCGGGALNPAVMRALGRSLPGIPVRNTGARGLPPMDVECAAFAWLARAFLLMRPGNIPQVTNAYGARVLGALYPSGPRLGRSFAFWNRGL